jgi:hypothetical protein
MTMLDNEVLRGVLARFAATPTEPEEDGIFQMEWRSTETFYRFTEEYVAAERRLEYKYALEAAFPGKKGVM